MAWTTSRYDHIFSIMMPVWRFVEVPNINGSPHPVSVQDDYDLSDEAVSHIIGMAWKDDVPFAAIEERYGLDEEAVVALMRQRLKRSSWTLWRERVQNCPTKHAARRPLSESVSRRPPGARSVDIPADTGEQWSNGAPEGQSLDDVWTEDDNRDGSYP